VPGGGSHYHASLAAGFLVEFLAGCSEGFRLHDGAVNDHPFGQRYLGKTTETTAFGRLVYLRKLDAARTDVEPGKRLSARKQAPDVEHEVTVLK
jgi:hypothetical protein